MSFLHGLLILLFLNMAPGSPNLRHQPNAIQAAPPGISLIQTRDKQTTGSFVNVNPFLTSSFLQALADESDNNKKRVQRFRKMSSTK